MTDDDQPPLECILRLLAQEGPDDFANLVVTAHAARVLITRIESLKAQPQKQADAHTPAT